MNFTEEIKKEARLEGWQRGQKDGWQRGQKDGWQKGQKEGRQKERQQFVLKMLQKKTDISFISEVTGLSEREIKKLKNGA